MVAPKDEEVRTGGLLNQQVGGLAFQVCYVNLQAWIQTLNLANRIDQVGFIRPAAQKVGHGWVDRRRHGYDGQNR